MVGASWSGSRSVELGFFSTFKTGCTFIKLVISMAAAKMAVAIGADHETHSDIIPFFTDIAVLFFFSFWHMAILPFGKSLISVGRRHC